MNKPAEDPQPIQLDKQFKVKGVPLEYEEGSSELAANGITGNINYARACFSKVDKPSTVTWGALKDDWELNREQ